MIASHEFQFAAAAREEALSIFEGIVHEGSVDAPREELLASIALVLQPYARHGDKVFPASSGYELSMMSELAALLICETRQPCSYSAMRAMAQATYSALQNADSDDITPPDHWQRKAQLQDLLYICGAASETRQQVAAAAHVSFFTPIKETRK